MATFEGSAIATYMRHLYDHTGSKTETRDFLRMYLMERAKQCDTSNRFESLKKAVYQNPDDDVLDAEILRLSILKNHNHQFLYNDGLNETPRDMLKGLRYMARANLAAKMLSEFKPQKDESQMSENKKAYFEEMRKLGSFWHEKTQKWYREGLESMKSKIIDYPQAQYPHGDEQVYWPKAYGKGVDPEDKAISSKVADKTMLSDILSDSAKAKWNKIMNEKTEKVIDGETYAKEPLKSHILDLEVAFCDLKTAIDTKDEELRTKSEKSIDTITKKVLI